jgi:hypothetical protein
VLLAALAAENYDACEGKTSAMQEILAPLAQLTSGLLGGAFVLNQYRVIQSEEASE